MLALDDRPERVHQLQHADLIEDVQEVIVPLEERHHEVPIQKVVECLLPDCFLSHHLGAVLPRDPVAHSVPFASEHHFDVDVVLEHVVRGAQVILEVANFVDLSAEVAREIESSELEGLGKSWPPVERDFKSQAQLLDKFVGDVFFGGTIAEELGEEFLKLK